MEKITNVSQIGEKGLIQLFSKIFSKWPSNLILGAGPDDCAVIKINANTYLTATTDMLHRTTDFPLQMTAWQIGWMSVAVNLSDVAAMGAKPIGIMVAIGMPENMDVVFIENVAKGMNDCAAKYNTCIIGGDIDTHEELTICGTALGIVDKDNLITRKGAKIGDFLCVTGYTGSAGVALYALENNIQVSKNLINKLLEPQPRIYESMQLANTKYITSMMDTSDGIAISLYNLKDASGVSFLIYEDKLPIQKELNQLLNNKEIVTSMALYSGGDFELIFTVDPNGIEEVLKFGNIHIIGKVVPIREDISIICENNNIRPIEYKGYEQLKRK